MRFTPRRERHKVNCPKQKKVPWGITVPLKSLARYNVQHLRFRRSVPFILAGAVHDIQTNDSRDTGMSRLRRPSDLCSSTLSDTAYRLGTWEHTVLPYGRKNPLPFPYFGAIAGLWSAPDHEQRETGVKRVETAGVYPLAHRRGYGDSPAVRRRQLSAEVQRKTSARTG